MRHIETLKEDIRNWAESERGVRALLWYGSVARSRVGPYSDLDAAILHDGEPKAIVSSLRESLSPRVREVAFLEARKEAVVWVDDRLTKIDLRLVTSPEGLTTFATSPDVPEPRFVVVLDKDARCESLVAAAEEHFDPDFRAILDEEIEKFLIAFESASNAHRYSDGYRCYFEHNIALHRLARLIEIARGSGTHLYLPRLLLSRTMSVDEQAVFRELRGDMYLPKYATLKRALASNFLRVLEEVASRFSVARDPRAVEHFLEAIIARDRFYNVRDFADAYAARVRPRVLFRGSTFSRWQDEPDLWKWVEAAGIRRVLDFRRLDEAEAKHRYTDDVRDRLGVLSLPFEFAVPAVDPSQTCSVGERYFRDLCVSLPVVIRALRVIGESKEGATAVHCYAGKDRTGWFCATLGCLLGLDQESIVNDFLLSGQDTRESAIREFLGLLEVNGGAEAVLTGAGFTATDLFALRRRLILDHGGGR